MTFSTIIDKAPALVIEPPERVTVTTCPATDVVNVPSIFDEVTLDTLFRSNPVGNVITTLLSTGKSLVVVKATVVLLLAPAIKLTGITEALDKEPSVMVTPEIPDNVSIIVLLLLVVETVKVPVVPEAIGFLILDKVKSLIVLAALSVPPERVIVTT